MLHTIRNTRQCRHILLRYMQLQPMRQTLIILISRSMAALLLWIPRVSMLDRVWFGFNSFETAALVVRVSTAVVVFAVVEVSAVGMVEAIAVRPHCCCQLWTKPQPSKVCGLFYIVDRRNLWPSHRNPRMSTSATRAARSMRITGVLLYYASGYGHGTLSEWLNSFALPPPTSGAFLIMFMIISPEQSNRISALMAGWGITYARILHDCRAHLVGRLGPTAINFLRICPLPVSSPRLLGLLTFRFPNLWLLFVAMAAYNFTSSQLWAGPRNPRSRGCKGKNCGDSPRAPAFTT